MLKECTKVLARGDSSGNDMLLQFHFSSGLDIFGLPTKNHYGGDWDLGPTWNYLVLTDTPFLVDAGRFHQTDDILNMMKKVGFNPADLGFILLSHGHEDHDGGVAALAEQTGAEIRVHPVYERLIRVNPSACPVGIPPEFPAKCWNCIMPEDFTTKNCVGYHRANRKMAVVTIDHDPCELMTGVTTHATPGHSPDSLCTVINREVIIVGDTILPEITPWPTTLDFYTRIAGVLDGWERERIFGLQAFVHSLHRLRRLGLDNGPMAVLPAHRLYYRDEWNDMDLVQRVDELFEHHLNRCADTLQILESGPLTAEEIAIKHFPGHMLKGPGKHMATNEMLSHLELMEKAGDVTEEEGNRYAATGTNRFEGFIRNPDTADMEDPHRSDGDTAALN